MRDADTDMYNNKNQNRHVKERFRYLWNIYDIGRKKLIKLVFFAYDLWSI